jgi:hypothetical protein
MLKAKQLTILAGVLGGLAFSAVASADGESTKLLKNSYQQTAEISCAGATDNACVVLFPPMTDDKTLITGVSCSVIVTPGSLVGFVLSHYGTGVSVFLPGFVFSQGTSLQAAMNATVNSFYNKGDQPAVLAVVSNGGQFSSATGTALGCTISGYHS